jgi:uncharacterized protein YndB with AHSA1/START domain
MPILAAVMLAAIFAILVSAKPDTALLRQKLVAQGLERLGRTDASWRTLVILSSREIDVPPAVAFKAWANPALVGQDQAIAPLTLPSDRRWSDGSRFEETLDLGFPLAHLSQTNRVEAVKPGSEISWRNETGSLDSYQTWSFQPLPDGGTRITVVQIFDGIAIGLGRYMVQDRWQQRFDEAIDGLVLEALRQAH